MNNNEKCKTEQATRKGILATARRMGCEIEIMQVFDKYDKLLRKCSNEEERKHISTMGIVEIYRVLGCVGGLTVGGKEVLPDESGAKNNA